MARSAIAVIVQTLVTVCTLFFLYGILLKTLGPDLLGLWSLVIATTSVSRVAELGFSGGIVKFVAQYSARNEPANAALTIETAVISIAVLMTLLAPLAYWGLAFVLHRLLTDALYHQALAVLPLTLASLWLTCVGGVFQSGLDARQRFDLRAGIVCSGQILFFILAVFSVKKFGLIGLVSAQVAQATWLLILNWWALRRLFPEMSFLPFRWRRVVFREIFGYSVTFQASGLVQLLFEPTTKLLLSKYSGVGTVAYFEMASRLTGQARALLVTASQVLVPAVAGLVERDPAALPRVYARSVDLMTFLSAIGFATLALMIPVIAQLWIGRQEPHFVLFAYFLLGAWWINSLSVPAYHLYLGIGKLRWNFLGHVLMGLINVLCGFTLGFRFGASGVVMAMCIALVVGSGLSSFAFHREYALTWQNVLSRSTIRLSMICVIAFLVGIWMETSLSRTILISTPELATLTVVSLMIFGTIVIWATRGNPIREFIGQSLARMLRGSARV